MKTGGDVLDVENDNMASGPGVGWIAEVCFVSYRTAFFSFFSVVFTMEELMVLISILTSAMNSLFSSLV